MNERRWLYVEKFIVSRHRSKFYGMNDVTRTGERNMALLCWETKSGHINQHIATSTAEFSAQVGWFLIFIFRAPCLRGITCLIS